MPDNPEKKAEQAELYAGKYKTKEDFEKGYWNSQQEGMAQREARIRAEAQLDQLQRQLTDREASKPNAYEANLRQHDIPVDDLNALIEQRANEQAHNVIRETLGPLTQAIAAQSEMSQHYEDFDLNRIQRAVGSDPMVSEQYNRLLGTDPRAAYQMGYMAMKAQAPAQSTKEKAVNEPSVNRGRQQDAAAVRSAGSNAVQNFDNLDGLPNDEQYDALLERGYSGDWLPFLRARLGGVMDEHIDPTLHLENPDY